MLSVTAENFAREVLQTSRIMPVVVDFWGEECGPCKALAPVLERLEPEYAGRLKIVKLDAGLAENRELTMRLGVRGVPTLVAFGGGEPVRRAVGNVPEPELRKFFHALQAGAGEVQAIFRRAIKALEEGDRSGGIAALREAVARDPAHVESLLALLMELGRIAGPSDEKRLGEFTEDLYKLFPQFAAVGRHAYPYEIEAIQLRMNCLSDRPAMPEARALREQLEAVPEDDWTRLTLARRLIAEGDFAVAAELLLKGFERGGACALIYFRNFRSTHILAGTWNDEETGRQLDEAAERDTASGKRA